MAITYTTNTGFINLNNAARSTQLSTQKLATGRRINSAADDAASLGVTSMLETQSRSTSMAMRNINDGIAVAATAESAADTISDIVVRMRELAVQGSSDTLGSAERDYLQDEYLQLREEIDRIASTTEFNGVRLTDGTHTRLTVQVGANNSSDDTINIKFEDLTAVNIVGMHHVLTDSMSARMAIQDFDTGLTTLNTARSNLGAGQNRLASASNLASAYRSNMESAESQMLDTDYAAETAKHAANQIKMNAAMAVRSQMNAGGSAVLQLLG